MPAFDLPTLTKKIRTLIDERSNRQYTLYGEVKRIETFPSGYKFELCEDKYVLSCFASNSKTKFPLENGMRLAVTGSVQLWERDARLQIRAAEISLTEHTPNIQDANKKLCNAFEKRFAEEPFTLNGVVQIRKNYFGTLYFDLISEDKLINCELPKSVKGIKLEDGKVVEVTGTISIWKQTGKLQIDVSKIEMTPPIPEQFRQDMKHLADKALWPRIERPIPEAITKIGLITGINTLAYGDFTHIYQRDGGKAEIVHVQANVQGEKAPIQITHAINSLSHAQNVDVIVITRGGGSEKDLEAFNNLLIADAICQSRVPVITAIGHAANTSLADVVADFQAFSPSDAAHILLKKSASMAQKS